MAPTNAKTFRAYSDWSSGAGRRLSQRFASLFVVLLAAGVALGGAACAEQPKKAGTASMEPEEAVKELRVNKVMDLIDKPGGAQEVVTDRSGTLHVRRPEHFATLAMLKNVGALASIEFDPTTKDITEVGAAPRDLVMQVVDRPTSLSVQLMKRPTLLHVESTHPRFQELSNLLREAQAGKTAVSVGVLPGSSRIEDVRPD